MIQMMNSDDYLSDYWNFVDSVGNVVLIIHSAERLVNKNIELSKNDWSMILLLIGLCFAGLRAISVLRIFDTFAYLIQMLRQSLSDMVPFLLLIYLLVFLFTVIDYVMKGDNLKNAWG